MGYGQAMTERFELLVIGAGPCGIAVGAAARQAGLSCALFDKGCITSSLMDYPSYMTFFSTTRMLEVGGVPFTIPTDKPTRREALAYYRFVAKHWALDVRQYEAVTEVLGSEGAFEVRTQRGDGPGGVYRAAAVVIATGGFQEPNLLDVPGEELPKVRHYYREPYPYFDQDVLVVGGSNSAVEAALEMYRNGARVTLAHFREGIDGGVKPWVVPDITNRLRNGDIDVLWRHRVAAVRPSSVILRSEVTGATTEIANDWVLAMTGWRADPRHLRDLGASIDESTGIPFHDPETMATDVPGVYLAGVVAAGHDANKIFIENGREHGPRIVRHRLALRADLGPR